MREGATTALDEPHELLASVAIRGERGSYNTLSAAAADWSLSWADPDPAGSPDATGAYLSAAGDAAIGAGSGLLVYTVFGSGGGGFNDLTAAAFVAGADAGRIQLKVTYGEW